MALTNPNRITPDVKTVTDQKLSAEYFVSTLIIIKFQYYTQEEIYIFLNIVFSESLSILIVLLPME